MSSGMRSRHPDRLIRVGALLLIAGELVALFSQLEAKPDTFVLFILGGGCLIGLGAVLGTWGVLSRPT